MNMTPKAEWTDEDYVIFEKWIRGVLHTGKTEVIFTKKDGTDRVMNCSLDPALLPPPVIVEGNSKKVPKALAQFNVRVFDIEKQGWRSFDVRSIKSIRFFLVEQEEETDTNWPFPTGEKP